MYKMDTMDVMDLKLRNKTLGKIVIETWHKQLKQLR